MTTLLAIDPGSEKSAFVYVDLPTRKPVDVGIEPNRLVQARVNKKDYDHLVIEKIASYGMSVGRNVFDTAYWTGVFDHEGHAIFMTRQEVKKMLGLKMNATDADVINQMVLRFTPGEKNYGKGTVTEPGWFYGFKADIWQAYALAVACSRYIRGK